MESGFVPPLPSDVPYPRLTGALWRWLIVASQLINGFDGLQRQCDDFFIKASNERFERRCRERTIYAPDVTVRTLSLPQVADVDRAIAEEQDLHELHRRWIGGGTNLMHLAGADMVSRILPWDVDYEKPADLTFPTAEQIERMVRSLHAFVTSTSFEAELLTPLWNLHVQSPIVLEEGLSIEALTDDDALRALRLRAILGDIISYRHYDRIPGRNLALRRRYSMPKVALPALPTPEQAAAATTPEGEQRFGEPDRLLTILPLVIEGLVKPGPIISRTVLGYPWGIEGKIFGPWATNALDDSPHYGNPVILDDDAAANLVRYWNALRDDPAQGAIELAMRRLRYATERRRDHDRILDLMIAAEALFVERGEDHEELRFRSSIHAAFFLESESEARKAIFQTIRGGYDARSAVAHGDEPSKVKICGRQYDLRSLIPQVQGVVRRALGKRLDEQRGEIDWKMLLVGV
jgi:hypothetical protein